MAEKEKNEKEKLFDKINTLYDEYVILSLFENFESIRLSVKEQILIAIYNVYVNIPKTAEETAKKKKKEDEDVNYNSYADEIVAISVKCLKKFGESKSASKKTFSQNVCFSIKRKLNFLKEKEELEQKNGGMEISDSDFKKAKKAKSFDDLYKKRRQRRKNP